jgi:PhoH-like ATPase
MRTHAHCQGDMSENGRHARQFSRFMDEMRAQGELARGVDLPGGTKVRVELGVSSGTLPMDLSMEKADNRMLALALSLHKEKTKKVAVPLYNVSGSTLAGS